jgi:hypothetical protein
MISELQGGLKSYSYTIYIYHYLTCLTVTSITSSRCPRYCLAKSPGLCLAFGETQPSSQRRD